VYKVDFFKKKVTVNLNDQLVDFPMQLTASNNMPGKVYQALIVGENKDAAVAIVFEPLIVTEQVNKEVKNTQTNLMT
jgi:hypothetical protein